MTRYAPYIFLLAISFALLMTFVPASTATVTCTWNASACGTATRVLGAQNSSGGFLTNSHAELPTDSNYTGSVCCSAAGVTINISCGTSFLKLSSDSNAHVEQTNNSNYAFTACMNTSVGTLTCQYADGTCPVGTGCVASLDGQDQTDNSTNAHIGDCTAYTRKVCCASNAPPTQTNPILNASDNPLNRTSAILTAWNQSTVDANGDTITNIYSFRINNTPLAVLEMPFDSNIATTTAGAVRDYARGNNGTLGNGSSLAVPTWNATGVFGGAYMFDGVNDTIIVQQSADFNLTSVITVAAWIKPGTQTTTFAGIVSKTLNNSNGWELRTTSYNATNTNVSFRVVGDTCMGGVTAVPNGAWTYLVGTYDGQTATLYSNGTAVSSNACGIPILTNNISVQIGKLAYSNYFFNGTIDDVRIYNRSLTQGQISEIMNETANHVATASIVPAETFKGDTWDVDLTPNDGLLDGITLRSNNLTIQNSPPNAVVLMLLANNTTTLERYPTFTWNTIDNDSDVVTSYWTLYSPAGCAAIPVKNTTGLSYTSVDRLCVDKPYNWTVAACDSVNACTANASNFTFTINSSIGIVFTRAAVDFGTMLPSTPTFNSTNNTLTSNPQPLVYNNTGNVNLNASVLANAALWSLQPLGTFYFEYADENSSAWTPFTGSAVQVHGNLTVGELRELEINITVPQGEPATAKNTTIRAQGVSIE